MEDNLKAIKSKLKTFIGQNKVQEAVFELKRLLEGRPNALNHVLLLERRLQELKQKVHRGEITESTQLVETTKIHSGLLNLIDTLTPADPEMEDNHIEWKKPGQDGKDAEATITSQLGDNLDIQGNFTGGIHLNRQDSRVSHVDGKEVMIATGKAKATYVRKMLVEIIPFWIWAVLVAGSFITAAGWWGYRYWINRQIEKRLFFGDQELGILIADYMPVNKTPEEKKRGADFAHAVRSSLRYATRGMSNELIAIKRLPPEIRSFPSSDEEAIEIGHKYGAKLVVWGEVRMEPDGVKLSSTIQPIKSARELFVLDRDIPKMSDEVEFESYAESVANDIQKLASFILGYIYYMNADNEHMLNKAIQHFTDFPRENPTKADAYSHFYLGNAYYFRNSANDREKAKGAYRKALALYDELVDAYHNLGSLALQEGRANEARQYLEKAESISNCPGQQTAEGVKNIGCALLLHKLATAYLDLHQYEKALEYYPKAIRAYQNIEGEMGKLLLKQAYNNVGYTFIQKAKSENVPDHYKTAKRYLETAMGISIEGLTAVNEESHRRLEARLHRNFARVHLGFKEWEPALKHLSAADAADSDYPDVYLLLFKAYNGRCSKGDLKKSMQAKERYLKSMAAAGRWLEAQAMRNSDLKSTCTQ